MAFILGLNHDIFGQEAFLAEMWNADRRVSGAVEQWMQG